MPDPPGDARERVLFEGQRVFITRQCGGLAPRLRPVQRHRSGRAPCRSANSCAMDRGVAGCSSRGDARLRGALLGGGKSSGLFHQIASLWIPLIAVACFVAGPTLPVFGALDRSRRSGRQACRRSGRGMFTRPDLCALVRLLQVCTRV